MAVCANLLVDFIEQKRPCYEYFYEVSLLELEFVVVSLTIRVLPWCNLQFISAVQG